MRWTMRWTMAVCAVAVLTACAPGGDQAATGEAAGSAGVADGDPLAAAAATITPEDYRARLEVIAHDSMRGRFTPSPELEEVAAWIRDRFESFGLEAFEQRYELSEFARSPIVDAEGNPVTAPNTVGILRGSDPELADEYVVFSAHMDHVGVGRPDASGDSIYNGADDDGSGTTAIVELAEAFASLPTPPRRSLIFVTVSGEERGLWGSAWFASHMPVPAEAVVADLNIDMIGRNWPDTIVAIGRQQSELGPILEEVNAAHPELGMTAIDDLWPEERFYFRSDHYNFARQGIPILFFFNGVHEDYHRPSDEVDKIDFDKASRVARLIFYLGAELANRDARPEWDPEAYRQVVEGAGR